jgi:hypothetical protein
VGDAAAGTMLVMPAQEPEGSEPTQPGDAGPAPVARESRRLAEPPSARYAPRSQGVATAGGGSALRGPLARATLVAVAGALLLTVVGAILASTFGLLFAAGVTGAAVGLVLARAAVPADDAAPVARGTVAWLALGLSIGAVAIAALATWAYARSEGGTLGLLDYLLETFGPFVPAEAVIAAVTSWWGATTGPVQR